MENLPNPQLWTSLGALGSFVLSAITLVIAFDCIWRVEGKLDRFLKILVVAIIVRVAYKGLGLAGFAATNAWPALTIISNHMIDFVILASFLMMYRVVRSLNHEKNRS
jgi:hypothetical protein